MVTPKDKRLGVAARSGGTMKRSIFAFVAAVASASTTIASVSGSVAGAQGEETTGVDKTTIKVGYVYIDTSALAGHGVRRRLRRSPGAGQGLRRRRSTTAVGSTGARSSVSTYRFDPLAADPLAVQRAACLSATEDDGVFVGARAGDLPRPDPLRDASAPHPDADPGRHQHADDSAFERAPLLGELQLGRRRCARAHRPSGSRSRARRSPSSTRTSPA